MRHLDVAGIEIPSGWQLPAQPLSYAGLRGGGHVVGVNQDDPIVDLIDFYSGSLRL